MDSSLIANQLQKDRENAVSARPYSNDTGNRLQLYEGKVRTVNPNSTYQVELLGDDGYTVLALYDGVLILGAETDFSVGDIVVLMFKAKDYPVILATGGGGGSTCSIGIQTFGVLFG